jgi:hypothetical protein
MVFRRPCAARGHTEALLLPSFGVFFWGAEGLDDGGPASLMLSVMDRLARAPGES